MFGHFSAVAAVLIALAVAPAHALERPRAAALPSTASTREAEPFAGAFDRVMRADLDQLLVVNTAGTPALALGELQLAVGCVGETPACLSLVAKQLEVEVLLLTNIDRAGEETVVTVAKFDARGEGSIKRAVRRASGAKAETELLGGADGMLRELFGLPALPPRPVAEIDLEQPKPAPVAALVTGAAGAAAVITGAIFAGLGSGNDSAYARAPIQSQADVNHAIDLRETGNAQYTTGGVLIGVGAAALVAAAVLFFLPAEKAEGAAL